MGGAAAAGGIFSTLDYRAFLLVCGLVALDGLLYLPFLLKYDRELLTAEKNNNKLPGGNVLVLRFLWYITALSGGQNVASRSTDE